LTFHFRYWHVNAQGSAGQTQPNFNDFTSFSGFTSPVVKQFGQNINLCSTTVNINVYSSSKSNADAAATFEKSNSADNKLTVGLLMSSLK
jgi:hypothetical protein